MILIIKCETHMYYLNTTKFNFKLIVFFLKDFTNQLKKRLDFLKSFSTLIIIIKSK